MQSIIDIFKTLESNDRKKIIFLLIFILITFFLELLSISLVIPIVTLLFDDNFINKFYINREFSENFENFTSEEILIFFLCLIVLIYLIKTLFLIFFSHWKSNFIFGLHKKYAKKLYLNYINQNYLFHLNSNSSNLTKNIVSTQNFAHNINQISILLTEILILFGLIGILLFINLKSTIFIFVFTLIVAILFLRFFSPILSNQGKKNISNLRRFMENINSSFFAIKEIKIMGRESFFFKKFSKSINKFSDSEKIQEFVQSLPRYILEFMSILLLVITIFFMMFYNFDKISILTFIALFAAVGFKIIPSINKIIFAYQHLKFYLPVSKLVIKDLKLKYNERNKNIYTNNFENYEVNFKKFFYKYPNSKNYVLKNINLKIKKNEIIGIVGSSGSGKTTLVNCLIGLLPPTKGKVEAGSVDIFDNIKSWQLKIGYVPQQVFLTDEDMFSNIAFGIDASKIDKKKIYDASKISKLDNFLKSKKDYKKIVGERGMRISGGQLQRVGIARALYNDKQILIFDEATSALDKETEISLLNSIKFFKGKKTIIIISHKMSTLKICNKIFKLKNNLLIQ